MSNIPEQTGKTITSIADALKGNPSCLAAICLAGIFAVLTYMSLTNERAEMHERAVKMIERCFPINRPERVTLNVL